MNSSEIARICHEANRAYCLVLGDYSHQMWSNTPDWQRESVINGVEYHLANPQSTPPDSHKNWLRLKLAEGWVYGEVKDTDLRTHPCLMPFHELPEDQQVKDILFLAIIRAVTE